MSAFRPIDRWFIDEILPHERRYLAVAVRLTGNDDEARDLVQEAYARLFTIDGWAAIESPAGYVVRTIRNMAIERMRRAKVVDFRQISEIDGFDAADDAPDAFRVVAGRSEARRLMDAIHALPERCRTVVMRRRLSDETPREIAAATGISLSTLEKRLARGMQLLTAALAFDGVAGAGRRTDIDEGTNVDDAAERQG